MSTQRKISIRKVLQTLVTIIVVSGCTLAILSADRLQRNKKVKSVTVHMRNSNKVHFLDEAQVMSMLFSDRHLVPENISLAQLDIHKMETIARTNPWVSDAQIFVDNERNMHVYVTQRVPAARLFEAGGNSYYLDTALRAMPLSESYVHYTPVVTAAPQLRDDSAGTAQKGTILHLVKYVNSHPFWNAQIAQIVVAGKNNFELIPVLGKQRILLGDTSKLPLKLANLFAFYQQVCNKVGWDKYQTIDLRYEGQVIASPALAWKAPVDRALSNMSWVKAVLEAGDKKENGADSVKPVPATLAVSKPALKAPVKPALLPAASGKNVQKPAIATRPKAGLKPKEKPKLTVEKPTIKPVPAAKPKVPKTVEKKLVKPDKKKDEAARKNATKAAADEKKKDLKKASTKV